MTTLIMPEPTTTNSMPTVHVIRDEYGERLTGLTHDDTQASMLAAQGSSVETDVPIARILEDDGIFFAAIDEIMDDKTWSMVARELKGYQSLPTEDPLYRINPPDLPPQLAIQRLDLIQRFMAPQEIQAFLELNEILMANKHQRPVNGELLTADSRNASFNRIFNNDLSELQKWRDETEQMAHEISTENASERAAFGDSAPGSAIQEALVRQQLNELSYVVGELMAPVEQERLSMSPM